MKRMCAWCGRALDLSESCKDVPMTHGLCPDCRREHFASARTKEGDARSSEQRGDDVPEGTREHLLADGVRSPIEREMH